MASRYAPAKPCDARTSASDPSCCFAPFFWSTLCHPAAPLCRSVDSHSGLLWEPAPHCGPAKFQPVPRFCKEAWDHRSQHALLRSTCRDSSVGQPTAVAWDSCPLTNVTVVHFPEFSQAGPGRHSQLCCLPVFHSASLIIATSGQSGMLQSNGFETPSPSLVTTGPLHQSSLLFLPICSGVHYHRAASLCYSVDSHSGQLWESATQGDPARFRSVLRFFQANLRPQISACFAQVTVS